MDTYEMSLHDEIERLATFAQRPAACRVHRASVVRGRGEYDVRFARLEGCDRRDCGRTASYQRTGRDEVGILVVLVNNADRDRLAVTRRVNRFRVLVRRCRARRCGSSLCARRAMPSQG